MKNLVLAAVALSLLSGCASMKRMTGQTNDTILPGQREEILSPDQQTARDPAVTGQPNGTAANQPIAQQPVNGAQPAMPGAPKPGAPLAMPGNTAAAGAQCDPKVDLCPEPMAPEPLPPPSPLKPAKVAGAKAGDTAAADAAAKAGTPIDPKTGKPILAKKKKIIKKKPVDAAATPAAPATTDGSAQVPAAPQPQGQ